MGTTTAGSSGKFEALMWHMVYEEEIGTVKGHFGPMNALAWFRDGRGFVTGGEDGYVIIWDSSSGKQIKLIQAHHMPVTSLNFSEDRMLMITCSKDQTAKIWAMDEYEVVKTYKTDRPLNDAAISPLYNADKDPKFHIIMGGGQDAKDVTTTVGVSPACHDLNLSLLIF